MTAATLRRRPRAICAPHRAAGSSPGAGFIGSHLVEALLRAEQHVVVLDDFSTGREANLRGVLDALAPAAAERLAVIARRHPRRGGVRGGAARGRGRAPPGGARVRSTVDRAAHPVARRQRERVPPGARGGARGRSAAPRLRQLELGLRGSPRAAEARGGGRAPALAVRGLEALRRALRARVRPLLRARAHRPPLLQRVRRAPGPRRPLRRGRAPLVRGAPPRPRRGAERRRRDEPRLLLTSRTRSRRTCSPRPRRRATRRARSTTSRSAPARRSRSSSGSSGPTLRASARRRRSKSRFAATSGPGTCATRTPTSRRPAGSSGTPPPTRSRTGSPRRHPGTPASWRVRRSGRRERPRREARDAPSLRPRRRSGIERGRRRARHRRGPGPARELRLDPRRQRRLRGVPVGDSRRRGAARVPVGARPARPRLCAHRADLPLLRAPPARAAGDRRGGALPVRRLRRGARRREWPPRSS